MVCVDFFCTRKSTIEIVNNFHMLENLCRNSGGVLFLKFFLNFKKRMLIMNASLFQSGTGPMTGSWPGFGGVVWESLKHESDAHMYRSKVGEGSISRKD